MTNQAQYDEFTVAMNHFDEMQQELGMSTVWSMYEFGTKGPEFELFSNKVRKVTYEFVRPNATVEELNADLRNGTNDTMMQVSSLAVNGSIKALWAAAESCIKQSGTHHSYIEDFEFGDDGALELVTGS